MTDMLMIFAGLATAGVVVALTVGIGGFGKGGKFNRSAGNKMMRLRLLLQFIAVLFIVSLFYFRSQGG